ncbi:rod shape-determining protein RodA [Patescibacteria group bacterium]|nr:rod shape-determining protein RodA [Patescibacteria group bacterium]
MNRSFLNIDWLLLTPVFIVLIISLVTLFSIDSSYFTNQLIFVFISIFAFLFFSHFNYKVLRLYSLPIYVLSIVALLLVFFLGIESRGSLRWIEVLGLRVQFSEILRPFLAISLASFIVDKKKLDFNSFFQILILLAPVVFLIFLQPDLGDAVIYVSVVLVTLFYFGFSLKYFLASFLPFFLAIPVLWNFLHDYQKQRILTFFNPGKDPLGTSYNVIQSIIAVGSGMIIGKGLGLGTQSGLKFLPERHTDFIFATISEQLGFVGAVIILICFGYFLYRIYKTSDNLDDKFAKTYCVIVFFVFLVQVFVNIGMNIGILPIVGVTLPFVSYGGSSLLSNFIFLGFLASIRKTFKNDTVLEIK